MKKYAAKLVIFFNFFASFALVKNEEKMFSTIQFFLCFYDRKQNVRVYMEMSQNTFSSFFSAFFSFF